MRYVDNQNITDPRLNLAIEEYLLRHVRTEEPLLLFYINEPSVIIGRNQNTVEEIDVRYVIDNGVHVVRRLSGGGAVYHDLGNLNFSFVTPGKESLHDFRRFTAPVIDVLHKLGVEAELRGKSDIFADGKKISGNAQFATSGRMFSHGTLLFDTDIAEMLKSLNPRQVKIESKAVQSVRNYVTNIRELLSVDMDILQLKQSLIEGIFADDVVTTLDLDQEAWSTVRQISRERYASWDWNYGHSPDFNVRKSKKFSVGTIDARVEVAQGKIKNIRLYGDYAGRRDVAELEDLLIDVPYDRGAITEALSLGNIDEYFGDLSLGSLVDLIY